MVISDGAPVYDSTLSVNPGNYLEKHLKNTVKWIENKKMLKLMQLELVMMSQTIIAKL